MLKGDMFLVGLKSQLPREVIHYTRFQKMKLLVKPELTCSWQVMGRNNIDFEEWMRLYIKYIDERNTWIDIKLIFKTFFVLFGDEKPKQFLNLLGEDTMIQMTVKRLLPLIPMERIFVVTGRQYENLVKEQLPNLPEDNIILEPYGRNTAPCIALSAFYISERYKDATLAVLPSDQLIQDEEKFLKA